MGDKLPHAEVSILPELETYPFLSYERDCVLTRNQDYWKRS